MGYTEMRYFLGEAPQTFCGGVFRAKENQR